jgi:hypothetical protein
LKSTPGNLDVIENGFITLTLRTRRELSRSIVETSSLATQAKIVAGVFNETLMVGVAVVWLLRSFARDYV